MLTEAGLYGAGRFQVAIDASFARQPTPGSPAASHSTTAAAGGGG